MFRTKPSSSLVNLNYNKAIKTESTAVKT